MKSQPTCFLFTNEVVKSWTGEEEEPPVQPEKKKRAKRAKPAEDEDEDVPESDAVWADMSAVAEDDHSVEETSRNSVSLVKKKRKV